jgi:hypothetical protein
VKIALDFDGTYTEDPMFWSDMIESAKDFGHDVCIVTFRHPNQTHEYLRILEQWIPVHFTSGVSKRKFMEERGIVIDVWIDDQPELIVDF